MKRIVIIIFPLLIPSLLLGENINSGNEVQDVDLGNLTTTKSKFTYKEGNSISSKILGNISSNNGDLTSALKMLPNVQYSNNELSSQNPGEIDPANISISGGLYYQNNFLIDGFNMNNDLDPSISGGNYNPAAITALPGQSQGLNIDLSLIESINVQDSNISAAYGHFSGGVIEATTKKATKLFGAQISYQITQGDAKEDKFSLTSYHINNDNKDSFLNSTSASNQPKFIKHFFRASLESKFSQNAGIVASFTTTQSFIPLNAYAQSYITTTLDSATKTQKRQSYNLYIKGNYDINDNISLEASYAYMPQYNQYFIVNTKDSGFDMLSGGHQAGIKASFDNNIGVLKMQSNLNILENSRTNSKNNMYIWSYSTTKNWNPNGNNSEGGYGNVNSKQITSNIKITQEFDNISFKNIENFFNIGLELGFTNAYYERLEDTIVGFKATKSATNCTDTQWCDPGTITSGNNGKHQYISRATLYQAGKIELNSLEIGSFVEDDININLDNFGEIQTRIGLRFDFDTYMHKVALAPRFSFNYNAPWMKNNFDTLFIFGANRYYGRNIFAYRLMDARSSLQWTLNRSDETTKWENATKTQNKNDTNFNKLKIPYSDELTGGISQNLDLFNITMKYIHRFGRDEIRRMCQKADGSFSSLSCTSNSTLTKDTRYIYTNKGVSESSIISLILQNQKSLDFFGLQNLFLIAFDYTNTKRNYEDYNDNIALNELSNQLISYNGKIIPYAEKPTDNFTRPYTLKLNTTHSLSVWKTTFFLNNLFRYRSGYNAMISVKDNYKDSVMIDGTLTKIDTFKPYKVKAAFTWDIRFGIELDIYSGNKMFIHLDITNVLNAKNIAIMNLSNYTPTAGATATPVYEIGRQIYLEFGYKF
ncbi:MAG: Plug domain-containing protein [Helicobacteraceae bacterium]|nr:Plug domain-containing protein [Helicobacteraceae bacterium]